MKQMRKIVLALALSIFTACVIQFVYATNDIIEFKDSNLKQALISQGVDKNNDGNISKSEAKATTQLFLCNKKIKDITELSYFENATYIDIRYNDIESLDGIKNLKYLKTLTIEGNKLNTTALRTVDSTHKRIIDNFEKQGVVVEGMYNQKIIYNSNASQGKPVYKVLFVYVTDIKAPVINNGHSTIYSHTLSAKEIEWFELERKAFEKVVEKLSGYTIDIQTTVYKTQNTITSLYTNGHEYWLMRDDIPEIQNIIKDYDTIMTCAVYEVGAVPHSASGLGGMGDAMAYFGEYSAEDVERLKSGSMGDYTQTLVHEFIHSVELYGTYIGYDIWEFHDSEKYFESKYNVRGSEVLAFEYYLQGGINPNNTKEAGLVSKIWRITPSKLYNQKIVLENADVTLNLGDKKELYCLAKMSVPVQGKYWNSEGLKWKSSNEFVAKVDQNGIITAVGTGNVTITVTDATGNNSASCAVSVKGKKLKGISIKQEPKKLEYTVGENFDSTGMVVIAEYDDKTTTEITKYIVIDGENLNENSTKVSISYTEGEVTVSAEQSISIKKNKGKLVGIKITKNSDRLTYSEGENFDSTGMIVIAEYDDKTFEVVTEYIVTDGEKLNKDSKKVTISYTEDKITVTTTQNISVKAKGAKFIGVKIAKKPNKLIYNEGEYLDKTGMSVVAVYENGDEIEVWNYVVHTTESLKAGTETVTVSYTENNETKVATFDITVNKVEEQSPNSNTIIYIVLLAVVGIIVVCITKYAMYKKGINK